MRADASVAQLGERQTEDLKVPGSIPGRGTSLALRPPVAHASLLFLFIALIL